MECTTIDIVEGEENSALIKVVHTYFIWMVCKANELSVDLI